MIREHDVAFLKLPHQFDGPALQADLAGLLPHMLRVHDQHEKVETGKLRRGATHYHTGGWEYVPLLEHGQPSCLDALPYIREAVYGWFGAEIIRARLLVLRAGHKINPHVGNQADGERVRYLVPITVPPEAVYWVEDVPYHTKPGELWYLNQTRVHWVANDSRLDRVVLGLDTRVNDWVVDLFRRAGVAL